uniref:LacI family DNA-binding transcriptional regulator n=1 Tax=Acetatifactor sp. TaxID=1872090 RepID=UPI00402828C4
MAKAVKLADIAERVGVSTVTVSKALSGQKGVSEEVREKIRSIAEDLGYQQPSAVRKSQNHKNFNIGILISERFLVKYESFYWQMYQAVATRATAEECFTMLEVIGKAEEESSRMPKLVQERKVDGIIVIGKMMDAYLQHLNTEAGIPVIYLDYYNGREASDSVISNSYYGTYELTYYLYRMGHRKIAYVGTLLAMESITDRYFGYQKALLELGLEQKKGWVLDDRHIETGEIDTVNMLQIPKDMPTAFVCNCDLTASFLIKKLKDNGYRVPEDISVVGFDNYLYPGLSDIQITTYEVDLKEMAKKAVYNMISKISNENYKPGIHIVEGHMVLKESVAQIPSGKA